MTPYHIIKTKTPDWSKVPSVSLQNIGWLPDRGIKATAQLCHDGENLYVRMEAVEAKIRAELKDPLAQVCEDSCLEFFFAPDGEDFRYFNFEFNLLGKSYIGFGRERARRARQLPANMEQFAVRPYETENGWGVTYQIPGDYIRLYLPEFSFSGQAACNFYKCGDLTETPHYLSWAPMTCDQPDYHRRQDFGTLIFD